jgi:hypothetical protein
MCDSEISMGLTRQKHFEVCKYTCKLMLKNYYHFEYIPYCFAYLIVLYQCQAAPGIIVVMVDQQEAQVGRWVPRRGARGLLV